MKYELFKREQFRKMQSTIAYFEDENGNVITVFYSYSCPELVKIRGNWYKFTYENSRKEWCVTSSRTTSKQLTKFYWQDWRKLEEINLREFENEYFHTWIDRYY